MTISLHIHAWRRKVSTLVDLYNEISRQHCANLSKHFSWICICQMRFAFPFGCSAWSTTHTGAQLVCGLQAETSPGEAAGSHHKKPKPSAAGGDFPKPFTVLVVLICCRTLNSIRGSTLVFTQRAEAPSTREEAIDIPLTAGMGSASNFFYTAVPMQLSSYARFRFKYQDPNLRDKLPPWKPPFPFY